MPTGALAWLVAIALQAPQPPPASEASSRAADRLNALRREAESLATQERTILGDLRRLEVERDLRAAELDQARLDLQGLVDRIAEADARVATLESTRAATEAAVAARLVEIYKLGVGGYGRRVIGAPDLREVGRAWRLAAGLAALDRRRLTEYEAVLASLRRERAELEVRRTDASAIEARVTAAATAAERAVAARAALATRITARRDLATALARELEAARQALERTVEGLDPATTAALPIRPFKGALDWPAAGRVTASFGRGTGRSGAPARRTGIDIGAPARSAVTAVHEGVVSFAGPFAGYGTLVIVDHGERAYTLYGYLATVAVDRGARVARGQLLGTVGEAPAGPAALYFEVRIDGQPVDPLQWLKPARAGRSIP